jgi:hypothetical protein
MNRVSYSQKELKLKYFAIFVAVLIGFGFGVFYGFNQGVQNYGALESVLVGYMNTVQVKKLKSGSNEDIKNVSGYLLIGVDHGLDQFTWYQEQGNHLLSKVLLADHVALLDKSIQGIAVFRSQDPEINLVSTLEGEESKTLYAVMYGKRQSVISEFGKTEPKK